MASTTPGPLIRASVPLARAAIAVARRPGVRRVAESAARRLDAVAAAEPSQRHPMLPAAVRVERAKSRRHGDSAEQTAVTMWFGQGPALPGPGSGDTLRTAIRLGTGIAGAAALAAMTLIAARREETRGTIVDAPAPLNLPSQAALPGA